ncbi:hypothetical protein Ancab_003749 [Ancistrocladus abbreviatus]
MPQKSQKKRQQLPVKAPTQTKTTKQQQQKTQKTTAGTTSRGHSPHEHRKKETQKQNHGQQDRGQCEHPNKIPPPAGLSRSCMGIEPNRESKQPSQTETEHAHTARPLPGQYHTTGNPSQQKARMGRHHQRPAPPPPRS